MKIGNWSKDMAFQFRSFASGSSGNCYLVKTENTNILVDVGIAGKHIISGLADSGLTCADVQGILLTHEHTDHVKSIRMMGRKSTNAEVYGSGGTLECVRDKLPENRTTVIEKSKAGMPEDLMGVKGQPSSFEQKPVGKRPSFTIGDILVQPFDLSHDAAEPTGYSLFAEGRQITIVTDTGCVTEDIYQQMCTADLLVLEANHEVNILRMGPYPYPLKHRILSDYGHLSNDTAGEVLCRILDDPSREKKGAPKIMLGHLSNENNTPQQAFLTVRNILFEKEYYNHQDLELSVIRRDQPSPLIQV